MTTQIKAGVIAANAVNSSELASGALSGQNFTGDVTFDTTTLVIDSTNNRVGIGTSSPTRKLSILGTGSEYINIVGGTTSGVGLLLGDSNAEINAAIICDNSTDALNFRTGGNNTRMTIDSSGNVGIGTSSPSAETPLTVYYSSTSQFNIGGPQSGISNNVYYNGSAYTNRNTSAGGALLQMSTDGSFAMRRATSGSSPTLNYSMYIDGSGNVGIGTTSPSQKLSVLGTASVPPARFTAAGNTNTLEVFGHTTTDTSTGILCNAGTSANDYSARFRKSDGTIIMEVRGDGNVGIGTVNPQAKLNTNLAIEGSILAYMSDTSLTFDGGQNVAVTHSSSALGTGTAGGLLLANNNNSNGAPSPLIAFSAKSALGNHNHTYATIHGEKSSSGADNNWNTGALIFSTGSGTGPNERMRIDSSGDVRLAANATGAALIKGVSGDQTSRNVGGYPQFTFVGNEGTGIRRPITNILAFDTSGDERMRINSSGLVSIGTTSALAGNTKLSIVGEATAGQQQVTLHNPATSGTRYFMAFGTEGSYTERGYIAYNGSSVFVGTVSDIKLKENIRDLDNGLSVISKIKPRVFDWKDGHEKNVVGFISQEIEEIKPNWVSEKDNIKFIESNLTSSIPYLIKAIQEQQTIIDDLKSRLDEAGL